MTVEADHVYRVGLHNALVHNNYQGGRHGDTKKPTGDGLDSHHMPPKSVNGLPPDEGPAIQMKPEDHRQTASHGSQPGSGYL